MLIRIAVLSFALCLVTGCSTPIGIAPAGNPSSTGNSTRSASFNTAQKTTAPTAKSQRLEAGETPGLRGYNDGYGDASVGDPRNPDRWLPQLGFSAADQQTYRQEYNRGYDSVTTISPTPTLSPSPTPTNSITPARRAELRQLGQQDGQRDRQSGFSFNPGSGITAWGITDSSEAQIYTAAYDAAYRQTSQPSTITPERRAELRQQGDNDGYNDAQLNLPQDTNRGITRLSLVNATEQRAYINGYNSGYKRFSDGREGVVGGW